MPEAKPLVIKPGVYDRTAAQLLRELRCQGVVLLVWGGEHGTGGSVAALTREDFQLLCELAERMQRELATKPAIPE